MSIFLSLARLSVFVVIGKLDSLIFLFFLIFFTAIFEIFIFAIFCEFDLNLSIWFTKPVPTVPKPAIPTE